MEETNTCNAYGSQLWLDRLYIVFLLKRNITKIYTRRDGYIPNNALENDELHHERLGEVPIHGSEEGDPHHQRIRQRRDGEHGDGPVEPLRPAALAGGEEGGRQRDGGDESEREELGEGVGEEEAQVHAVGVVVGDEVEGEDGDGERRDEAVNAWALRRGEGAPPPHRGVGEEHGRVQRRRGAQHRVQVP